MLYLSALRLPEYHASITTNGASLARKASDASLARNVISKIASDSKIMSRAEHRGRVLTRDALCLRSKF